MGSALMQKEEELEELSKMVEDLTERYEALLQAHEECEHVIA